MRGNVNIAALTPQSSPCVARHPFSVVHIHICAYVCVVPVTQGPLNTHAALR